MSNSNVPRPSPNPLVVPGGRWRTRGVIPRSIVIRSTDEAAGLATVRDEETGESWLEPIAKIERLYTRRASQPRMTAVAP